MLTHKEKIELNRHMRYEAEVAHERRRTDIITDASERIAAPMANSFNYELGDDGHLYFQGQPIVEVLDRGIETAYQLSLKYPAFQVELERRLIERAEYDDIRLIAQGGKNLPDALHVFSLTPDAVLEGVNLGAYSLERKKIMYRRFQRTDSGVCATSISLDGGDRTALADVTRKLGHELPKELNSEEVLAKRIITTNSKINVRREYDDSLKRQFGGDWYGGRRDSPVLDAMSFIEEQTDLLNEVMRITSSMSSNSLEYELAIQNFTASLNRRLRGQADLVSQTDSGDVARAKGENLKNDCPAGQNLSINQMMETIGLGNRVFIKGSCRVCLTSSMVGECMVCLNCEELDNAGIDLGRIHAEALLRKQRVKSMKTTNSIGRNHQKNPELPVAKRVCAKYGRDAVSRTVLVVGGARTEIYNRYNSEVIAVLSGAQGLSSNT